MGPAGPDYQEIDVSNNTTLDTWRRKHPAAGDRIESDPDNPSGRATAGPRYRRCTVRSAGGWPAVIYNGNGEIVEELEIPQAYCGTYDSGGLGGVNTGVHYCYRADVCGDSRDEVLVVGWKGVRIYANARSLAIPALYNTTIYRGM
jgi:hypothetical protein